MGSADQSTTRCPNCHNEVVPQRVDSQTIETAEPLFLRIANNRVLRLCPMCGYTGVKKKSYSGVKKKNGCLGCLPWVIGFFVPLLLTLLLLYRL